MGRSKNNKNKTEVDADEVWRYIDRNLREFIRKMKQ
jgi:hypothetical protein